MFDAINVATSGMVGFEKDLTVIGNNVANLNTPGFKASQLQFADLLYQSGLGDNASGSNAARLDFGAGLGQAGTRVLFTEGQLRQTGNPLDVAINGAGFFVVRSTQQTLYTRDGQFSIDAQGYLVTAQGNRVQALVGGTLQDINTQGYSSIPGKATATINLTGVLDTADATTAPTTAAGITVIDAAGAAHTLSIKLTNNNAVTPNSWLVAVTDAAGASIASGQVVFGGDGTPASGSNTLSFSYSPGGGTSASKLSLNFGTPGATSGVRAVSAGTSSVTLASQDGLAVGSLTSTTFDANGTLTTVYSNGQTLTHEQLALAGFSDLQRLAPLAGNLFAAPGDVIPNLGVASTEGLGAIAPQQVEIANIDLAQEFGALIISQRGYQASSQVISTANDMIQQLFDAKGRR